jgi:hypothetical protein
VPVAPPHPPPPPSTLLRSSGGRGVWAVSHGSGGAARWRERRRACRCADMLLSEGGDGRPAPWRR